MGIQLLYNITQSLNIIL